LGFGRFEVGQLISITYFTVLIVVAELNKSKALDILHELRDSVKDSPLKRAISLDNIQVSHIFTGGYQLIMKVNLDNYSRTIINELMKRHKLYMKEGNGHVTLRSIGD
jgi:hypothetical protein